MDLNKVGFNGLKWSSVGMIVRSLVQVIQISILTRFLPVEAFGLVAMALFVINFTNLIVEMGFTAAILNRQQASDKELSSLFWFNLLIGFILYLIIYLFSPSVSNFYEETELKLIITILGSNIIFLTIGRVQRTILQKNFKFKKISIVDIISSLIGLVLATVLAINNYGVYSIIYGTLISSISSSLLFLILKENKIYFHFRFDEIKPFFKVGSYSLLSSVLSFFTTDIDVLIIGKTLGPKSLGLYTLSKQIILKVFSVINPIVTNVLSPLLSSIQNDKKKIKSSFLKVTSLLSYLNLPIYLLLLFFSQEILLFLYGKEYVVANFLLLSFVTIYFISSISNPVGSLQIATGRTDIGFKWAVISMLISPIIIYFASLIDIGTVALSRMFLSLIMIIPLWFVQLKPMIKVTLKEYLLQFYKPLLFFILIFGANYFYLSEIKFSESLSISILIKLSIWLILIVLYHYFFAKKDSINLIYKLKLQLKR
jgi:O-antigen/teichoic acid export membrane protein